MKDEIPSDVIDWNSLSDEQFLNVFNSKDRSALLLSYLFYNDIPFDIVGCVDDRNWYQSLLDVFEKNISFGITLGNEKSSIFYKMDGIQEQLNGAVRYQYYHPSTIVGNEICCYAYYIECSLNEDQTITKTMKKISLVVDKSYCHKSHLIKDLSEKYKDNNEAQYWIHSLVNQGRPNSRMIVNDFLKFNIQSRYNKITNKDNEK